jgi:hypothetical protein
LPGPPGSESAAKEARIAELVRAYFAERPRAMDTVAGIMDFWLPQDIDLATMEIVLEKLRIEGILERVDSGDYVHYRLKGGNG